MKQRLFNNIKTTVVGTLLIVGSGVLVYNEVATIKEVSGWVTLGVTLVCSKDPNGKG